MAYTAGGALQSGIGLETEVHDEGIRVAARRVARHPMDGDRSRAFCVIAMECRHGGMLPEPAEMSTKPENYPIFSADPLNAVRC